MSETRERLLSAAKQRAGSPVVPGCPAFTERAFWLRFMDEVSAILDDFTVDDRTHGLNHAPLPAGVTLAPGFCAGCDAQRADEEAGS